MCMLAAMIFKRLISKGLIKTETISQTYLHVYKYSPNPPTDSEDEFMSDSDERYDNDITN